MNVLSLNIRGVCDKHKMEWLGRLKKELRFSVCGLQESRVSTLPVDIGKWWGNNNMGIDFVESTGLSGGIISFWDKSLFQDIAVIKNRYFLAVVGYWQGVPGETIFVNVYAPQAPAEKKELWGNIQNLMASRPGTWILFGDYNAVRRPEERLNSVFCPRIAADFNAFISGSGIFDLNMGGRRFTYFSDVGCKLSKIDWFLVCSNFLANFPAASVTAFPREYSDHTPILLKTSYLDFGRPSFRFFNSWLFRDGFDAVVFKAWGSFTGDGAPDRYLSDKLKHVKAAIKEWRRAEFDRECKALTDMRKDVNEIEILAESRMLEDAEISNRRDLKQKIMDLEKMARLDLEQKARIKWMSDGDEITAFFHNSLKSKNRRNSTHGMMINGSWVTDTDVIKKETWDFFSNKFRETANAWPKLVNPNFKN